MNKSCSKCPKKEKFIKFNSETFINIEIEHVYILIINISNIIKIPMFLILFYGFSAI